MNKLERAILYAVNVHAGQTDKLGMPYILHPLHVMGQFANFTVKSREALQIVAVLHDVVEDTDVTVDYIGVCFGAEIADAIDALTKREGERYREYLDRVIANDLAVVVKHFDIAHNSSEARLKHLPVDVQSRLIKKYEMGRAYIALACIEALERL